MIAYRMLALVTVAGLASDCSAQTLPRFRWQPGQVLTYQVQQTTHAAETIPASPESPTPQITETSSQLVLTKRWQITAVGPDGIATLQMSLTSLRMVTKKPDGESIVYDSARPDPSQVELNREMGQYVGPVLAVLRLDSQGRLVEVRECKFGPANRFESELPMRITLPDTALTNGLTWQRSFQLKLMPPLGTGESYPALQSYTCKEVTANVATIAISTQVPAMPSVLSEQIPLLPNLVQGEAHFNLATGQLKSVQLQVQKELKDHHGEGSSYKFASQYVETLVQ